MRKFGYVIRDSPHEKALKGNGQYKCDQCDYSTDVKDYLLSHKNRKHVIITPFEANSKGTQTDHFSQKYFKNISVQSDLNEQQAVIIQLQHMENIPMDIEILQEIPKENIDHDEPFQEIEIADESDKTEELSRMDNESIHKFFVSKMIRHGKAQYECTYKSCKSKQGGTILKKYK
ncbi:hypothetical protein PVAND_016291 [Polypedilum vanderplanki]|uniref:C2H2-type domain-containing protein n=1 Tax=Polypedilum vanderplanki TaxID=319348 RepID=A0A9J6BFS7_POLVA|nr:hypothetical protein PVAND_016291 [Polypedilum vanderplanki]